MSAVIFSILEIGYFLAINDVIQGSLEAKPDRVLQDINDSDCDPGAVRAGYDDFLIE